MDRTYRSLKQAQASLIIDAYHTTTNVELKEEISKLGLEIHNLAKKYFPQDFEQHARYMNGEE